jgi:hypothetical protein
VTDWFQPVWLRAAVVVAVVLGVLAATLLFGAISTPG